MGLDKIQNLNYAHFGQPRMQRVFMRTTKTDESARGCASWFESSLGATVSRYIFFSQAETHILIIYRLIINSLLDTKAFLHTFISYLP